MDTFNFFPGIFFLQAIITKKKLYTTGQSAFYTIACRVNWY
jgi:hypothetical protein